MALQFDPPECLELRFWHWLTVISLHLFMVAAPAAVIWRLLKGGW